MARARRRRWLEDFGDAAFVDPLRPLVALFLDEASLCLVGRMATRWDVVGTSPRSPALPRYRETRDPGILRQPIEAADCFITGLSRGGATFLRLGLLLEDAKNR